MSRKFSDANIHYNIDGTPHQKESTPMALKKWNLKEIVNDQKLREEAIKIAQRFVKMNGKPKNLENDDLGEDHLWSDSAEEIFFTRRSGLAAGVIENGSPEYYDFKDFFAKYKRLRTAKLHEEQTRESTSLSREKLTQNEILGEETEIIRNALVLFEDFRLKKNAALKEKILKDKAALPIAPYAAMITSNLREHRVILVAGDTGCGKSTQVPQILMQASFRRIACTQPRRIACFSLAKRVGYETMNEYGSQIGYQVRFEGNKSNQTRILFMTEGLLLRQFSSDPFLSQYDVIIVDEVHERHIMGDFLLGILKRLLDERKDLCVVLMSATISAELFGKYFNAPAIQVPGKMYDVMIHYMPQGDDDKDLVDERMYQQRVTAEAKQSIPSRTERINPQPYLHILQMIDEKYPAAERGDMLIFMSGINEISALADELKIYANYSKRWIILLLHSSLSVEEQDKVFDIAPEGVRKCIISSNIAETSVTIDGIRFIIDSGKVKELTHETTTNMSKLSEFWVSKASATQRTGRAGRTGPGVCWRLYSENEFNHLNDFNVAEIMRAPLEPIVLAIKAFDLGDAREFDFVERPSPISLESSILRLQTLGALDDDEQITSLGYVLSLLPVDTTLGKMLVMATIFNLIDPILTITAAMSVQSPFVRLSLNTKQDIAQNRRKFNSKHGDPFTILNLWHEWLSVKADRNESSRAWCKRHGVEEQRLYEMAKLKKQFEDVLNEWQPGIISSTRKKDGSWQQADRRKRKEQKDLIRRQKHQSAKKRKILKFEEEMEVLDDTDKVDIHDLEFSLANQDIEDMRDRSLQTTSSDQTAIDSLKLIVCSGLYPQLAIGDEFNPTRRSSEIVFHTKSKMFLSIHPSSVFFSNPEWIQGIEQGRRKDDMQAEEGEQLLCYLQLLETNKPYIVNLMRVPSVHTCLLFSKSIDTNEDATILVIDDFFIIRFKTTFAAQNALALTFELRAMWERHLEDRLRHISRTSNQELNTSKMDSNISDEDLQRLPGFFRTMLQRGKSISVGRRLDAFEDEGFKLASSELSRELSDFIQSSMSCSFAKAKPTELLKMFPNRKVDGSAANLTSNTMAWDPNNVIKQGVRITPYLRYGSVFAPSSADVSNVSLPQPQLVPRSVRRYFFWYCITCETYFAYDAQQATEHEAVCNAEERLEVTFKQNSEKSIQKPELVKQPNRRDREWKCEKCGNIVFGSAVDVLKHKKTCQNSIK